jgi:hypothetical protein
MMRVLFGTALAVLLLAPAQAAVTSFSGVDDGEIVGGGSANASAAQIDFFAAALGHGPVLTNYLDAVPLGFSTSFHIPGALVKLAAVDLGSGKSGITDNQLNPPGTGLNGYSTIESNTDNARWLGFPGGSATFSLNQASNSFGFYMTGLQLALGNTLTISFDGAAAQTLNVPIATNGGVAYFGFTSDDAFSQVTISRPGSDLWGIDGISFNGAVPEPASWAMLIIGFGLTGAVMRRRAAAMA